MGFMGTKEKLRGFIFNLQKKTQILQFTLLDICDKSKRITNTELIIITASFIYY